MNLPIPAQSELGRILVQAAQTSPKEIWASISDTACKIFSGVSLHGNHVFLSFNILALLDLAFSILR